MNPILVPLHCRAISRSPLKDGLAAEIWIFYDLTDAAEDQISMSMFRVWQPHSDEYMLVWNSLVAMYTLGQLSEGKRTEIYEHYKRIAALNRLDPIHDVTAHTAHDPFWLAFTMADLGVAPILGSKGAKWFDVVNPRTARARLFEQGTAEEIGAKVIRDICNKHGISLDPETLSPDMPSELSHRLKNRDPAQRELERQRQQQAALDSIPNYEGPPKPLERLIQFSKTI